MIKLFRGEPPKSLTSASVASLTSEYTTSGKSVWNLESIKKALLAYSSSKCAYCEESLDIASNYMEVEHFYPKVPHSHLVVEWKNLLPACKRCNTSKGKYDPATDGMIVNPADVYPQKHLYFSELTLRYRDDIGERTIRACNLNRTDRLFRVRSDLHAAMHHSLERTRSDMKTYLAGNTSYENEQKIVRSVASLLKSADPKKPYAAFLASSLLSDPTYIWIKESLQGSGLWEPLDKLEQSAKSVQLAR
ncbi:HNH endonuclease [Sphingomonas sp. ABOLD]|uniref:HNH endonuclease n=1 Tax=Sphingomonas sp. ABOLD TaxID=1985877 RepID=UPI0013E0E10B|nr:HNH endonuclease [Sphingomonas sp. ABOLD]